MPKTKSPKSPDLRLRRKVGSGKHVRCPVGFHPLPASRKRDEKGRILCTRDCNKRSPPQIQIPGGRCRRKSVYRDELMKFFVKHRDQRGMSFREALSSFAPIWAQMKASSGRV